MVKRWSRILVFTVLTYFTALILDLMVLSAVIPSFIWGFTRMWGVTLSSIVCIVVFRDGLAMFKRILGLSKKALLYYLLAPTLVYATLAIYIVLAMPLSLFKFNAYVESLTSIIRLTNPALDEVSARYLALISAITQIPLAYVAAISINALAALGEELGWRGYLYELLGRRVTLKNVIIIGVLWGLWHASAIVLLGYNYQVNRYYGVALFTVFTTVLTYPHLILVGTSGSVLPATSLHGAVNALWGLTLLASDLPLGSREILLGLGFLGIVAWTLVSIVLYIILRLVVRDGNLTQ